MSRAESVGDPRFQIHSKSLTQAFAAALTRPPIVLTVGAIHAPRRACGAPG
jgi:hypothetical protein